MSNAKEDIAIVKSEVRDNIVIKGSAPGQETSREGCAQCVNWRPMTTGLLASLVG